MSGGTSADTMLVELGLCEALLAGFRDPALGIFSPVSNLGCVEFKQRLLCDSVE